MGTFSAVPRGDMPWSWELWRGPAAFFFLSLNIQVPLYLDLRVLENVTSGLQSQNPCIAFGFGGVQGFGSSRMSNCLRFPLEDAWNDIDSMLYYIILYYIILYYIILYYIILYYIILYYIILYYIILYYIVLYYIILYYIILYCIVSILFYSIL